MIALMGTYSSSMQDTTTYIISEYYFLAMKMIYINNTSFHLYYRCWCWCSAHCIILLWDLWCFKFKWQLITNFHTLLVSLNRNVSAKKLAAAELHLTSASAVVAVAGVMLRRLLVLSHNKFLRSLQSLISRHGWVWTPVLEEWNMMVSFYSSYQLQHTLVRYWYSSPCGSWRILPTGRVRGAVLCHLMLSTAATRSKLTSLF